MSRRSTVSLAYTLAGAAAACSVSVDVVRRAVRRGDLAVVYPSHRPVVLAEELARWIAEAPTTRPAGGRP